MPNSQEEWTLIKKRQEGRMWKNSTRLLGLRDLFMSTQEKPTKDDWTYGEEFADEKSWLADGTRHAKFHAITINVAW